MTSTPELRSIAAIRRTCGELAGNGPSTGPADQLRDERNQLILLSEKPAGVVDVLGRPHAGSP
jgi:hypothetical protein